MKVKISELQGSALDWAVLAIEHDYPINEFCEYGSSEIKYSTDWTQGGPIIEREGLSVCPSFAGLTSWIADKSHEPSSVRDRIRSIGPAPLIAAMRCYVASKLGDEFDIPDELFE